MSMQDIEHQGYGFDIADLQPILCNSGAFDTSDRLAELVSEVPELGLYNYDDVVFVAPRNTDSFGMLVIIFSVIPVGDAIRFYSKSEANNLLINAVTELVKEGVEVGCTTDEDVDIIRGILTANIENLAGYSYDKGPWTDCI